MRTLVFAVIAVLALCFIAGCSSIDDINILGDGAASTVFSDIPVPSGFTLNESESYYQITDSSRSGHLLYAGWEDTSQLVLFYQEKLIENNWTMVSINISGYAGTMQYSKTLNVLDIELESGKEMQATIMMELTPT